MGSLHSNRNILANLCLTILLVAFSEDLHAQSQLELTLRQFDSEEVGGYVQPLGDLLGASMNAGLYHSARIREEGFHLHFDLIGMASIINDAHRTFDAKLPEGFAPLGGSLKTATVFGGKGTTFKAENGFEYKGSDGLFSTDVFPFFVPQLTIGTLWGSEASIRFISTPSLGGGKLPPATLLGLGARHSISQYFGEDPPLDVAIGGFYSTFSLGEFVSFDGASINLQVSKTLSILTIYGGTAWEKSMTSINYESIEPKATLVNLAIVGGNKMRFTAGIEIDLLAVKLFADANFGFVQHFSGGVGFGF